MTDSKLVTVFRFHKDFYNARERVKTLKYFDPDIPVYGLFGGDKKNFEEARKSLHGLAENVWLFPENKTEEWKWMHTDIMLKQWYREVGKNFDFDFIFSYEYDLLTTESLRKIYPDINNNSLALAAVTKLDGVEWSWSWTSQPKKRKNFLKFCDYMEHKFGLKKQKYVCLGPGPLFPREFLKKWAGYEDVDFVHEEISIPAYAEMLGFNLVDHGMHHGFEEDLDKEKFFSCRGHIKVKTQDIFSELAKPDGRRTFHPVKQNISLEKIKTAMIIK